MKYVKEASKREENSYATRAIVNARSLQLECAMELHDSIFMSNYIYESGKMI